MTSIHHGAVRCALAAAMLFSGISAYAAMTEGLRLTGAQEVLPVSTSGTGLSSITAAENGSISGSIKTTGVPGTAAQLHTGEVGVNRPVIAPLSKTSEGVWSVTAGAKLNAVQVKGHRSGGLQVKVHADAKGAA